MGYLLAAFAVFSVAATAYMWGSLIYRVMRRRVKNRDLVH